MNLVGSSELQNRRQITHLNHQNTSMLWLGIVPDAIKLVHYFHPPKHQEGREREVGDIVVECDPTCDNLQSHSLSPLPISYA
ncbi:hypothetical protein L1987_28458 [Smallanthus sonchifolius]|uniref:Uncharacterized protein n=1 Tax=Smallanthus sonchifolius TaxID=185202 RepID=A0ACB9HY33_9ASTR|nr:hypothetical protein L1987_28458 [Smallanthus sonchifolius]